MTDTEAYGLILLSSLFTAICVWLACWRYWRPTRLLEHDGYIRGWEACSRVRDREEVQARKELLLNFGSPNLDQCSKTEQVDASKYT